MFTVYVLQSLKNKKRYIGFTSKSIEQRMIWHEQGLTVWTRQKGPFVLRYSESYNTKDEAQGRERYFKTGQGRRTLQLLLTGSVSATNHGGRAKNSGAGRAEDS